MAAFRPKTEPTARDVRIWHWQKVLRYSNLLNQAIERKDDEHAMRWRICHSAHLGCVQEMNDLPGLSTTTAEQDLRSRNARRP